MALASQWEAVGLVEVVSVVAGLEAPGGWSPPPISPSQTSRKAATSQLVPGVGWCHSLLASWGEGVGERGPTGAGFKTSEASLRNKNKKQKSLRLGGA